MRTHIDIDLNTRAVNRRQIEGEALAHAGRYLIARTLLEQGVAGMDPLSPEAPLIFSADRLRARISPMQTGSASAARAR
jgi:aldehyde:ferredoxin oxidoreductase